MEKQKAILDDIGSDVMLGVPSDGENTVMLTEHRAMICLPENAVDIEIRANVYHDGEIVNVSKLLSMEDIRIAFQKADDGYIDDDDRFVLMEKGLQWLESQEKKRQ